MSKKAKKGNRKITNKNPKLRAAYYLRTGASDQKGINANAQRKALKEAIGEAGFKYVQSSGFEDIGYSGTDFERPGLWEMMDSAKAGLFDVLYLADPMRLSRDFDKYLGLWNMLTRYNVDLKLINAFGGLFCISHKKRGTTQIVVTFSNAVKSL